MKEKLKLILDYANANNDCWLRDKVQECLNELDGEYYLTDAEKEDLGSTAGEDGGNEAYNAWSVEFNK
jgi:hypothetical protein